MRKQDFFSNYELTFSNSFNKSTLLIEYLRQVEFIITPSSQKNQPNYKIIMETS